MPKAARSAEEIQKIKEEILNVALEIIIESGLEGLTMRKIASRMNMSATNLYNYFTNKDGIYLSILVRGYEILYGHMEVVIQKETEPEAKARALLKAYLRFGIKQPHYYDIMFSRPSPRYEDYKNTPLEKLAAEESQLTKKVLSIAKEATVEVLKNQSIPEDVIGIEAIQVHNWCMLHGMVVFYNNKTIDYLTDNPEAVYDALIDKLANFFLFSIAGK